MRPLLAAALLAAAAAPLSAQTIIGRVVERGTDRPLGSVQVALRDSRDVRALYLTETDGSFSFTLPSAGAYRLEATMMGYGTLSSQMMRVNRMDSVALTFRMAAQPIALDPVEVTVSRRTPPAGIAGFYERMHRKQVGRFLSREEIIAAHASRTSDLLRRVAGLSFRPTRKGQAGVRARGGCEPQVFVDGMEVRSYNEATPVDDLVRPDDLEGVEVYGTSGIPAQFSRTTREDQCGAVMLWTRVQ